ncbi:cation:proton antiporter [Roseovarius sp. A21]|uniref:Cation:proton antiporter n=1 Tax=Roseovarius bejariae TaxID=2576383 RepID=A0A844D217_9RHOB|nr:cation:proton antiporter [Roseovarius bejariae]MRU15258.1 cation:proton antiporter [Roseovarius bejariae]
MDLPVLLIALGALFLTGLLADTLGHRTRLPRVTILLACGIAVGPSGLDAIPLEAQALYDFLSVTALTMVAFLLGSSLTVEELTTHGRAILTISALIVVITMTLVTGGLWLLGLPLPLAILLGAIATATDPAATQDAIRQSDKSGPFPDILKGIVAIDDAWGLIAFSMAVVLAFSLGGELHLGHFGTAAWEVGGALGIGAMIGLPAAFLTGRLRDGEPMQTEALGIVFLTAGLAIWAEVSFLLAGMTAGALVANLARHHETAFHEIEHIQWPFMILFFLLAGASLNLSHLNGVGLALGGYVALRILGRALGGWIGGAAAATPAKHRPWYGMALLPQAGVAVGMALVAAQEFPEYADLLLGLTIATTVIFELIGPIATLWAINRVQRPDR